MMKTRLVVGVAFGAIGTLVWGCSSSSGGNNPYPDPEHFCAAVATAECQQSGNMGMPAVYDDCSSSMSEQQECMSFRTSECMKGSIIVPFPGSTSAMMRTYTSGNVQPCIDALNNAFGPSSSASGSGVATITYSQLFMTGGLVDTCEAVFVGSAGDDKTCATNYDCTVMGEVCAQDPLGTDLVCAVPSMKSVGDRCADPGDECTNGYCSTSGKIPTCVALVNNGSPCTADAECQTSSHCSAGTCVALGGLGSACSANTDCDPSQSLFCDVYHSGGPACVKSLSFNNGQDDCQGYLFGQEQAADAGVTPPAESGTSSEGGADSGAATDAASGG